MTRTISTAAKVIEKGKKNQPRSEIGPGLACYVAYGRIISRASLRRFVILFLALYGMAVSWLRFSMMASMSSS